MRLAQPTPVIMLAAAAAFSLAVPRTGFSLGTRITDQSAEATARANAFTATADDPSAVYYNPAGITQMQDGLTSLLGYYGIFIHEDYKPLEGDDTGAQPTSNHEMFQGVPQVFSVLHPAGWPVAFGLGSYSPFGFKNEYPDNATFRQAGLLGSIEYLAVNPVVAVQVTRSLSIAAGVSLNYVDGELEQGLTAVPGDSFTFKGEGFAFGYNAGLLWKPTERQSIGIDYHGPVNVGLEGHDSVKLSSYDVGQATEGNEELAAGQKELQEGIAEINSLPIPASEKQTLISEATAKYDAAVAAAHVPASGEFPTKSTRVPADGTLHFPQYATIGYSFRPTPDWNIETDIDWTDWNSLTTLTIHQPGHTNVYVPFNWKDSFMYRIGATKTFGEYHVSAGYMYSENSVPTTSFTPIVPDSDRDIFSLGVGRKWGSYSMDIAWQLSYGPKRTIDTGSVADGRYYFLSNAITVSVGHHF